MASADRTSPAERALLPPLLCLTVVTGLVDAASYLGLGHVFTANMTGNVVFLAFALAGAPGLSILRCSTALLGFVVGAALGGRLAVRMKTRPRHLWATTSFAAEAALLLTAAAVSLGGPAVSSGQSARLSAVILLTAIAMGLRNATVRSLAVPDMTTTVLTLTITGLAADSALAGGSNPRWPRRVASVLAMSAGAAIGVLLLRHSLALPLGVSALVACVCAVIVRLQDTDGPASGV